MSSAGSKGKVVIITGPSGVGKSTIVKEVVRRGEAVFSVSATTRKPRAGEVDGKDYRFVDHDTFRRMIDRGELLEWAKVFGEYYGTVMRDVQDVVDSGRTIVLEIDIQGGLQVSQRLTDATYVLIVPPDDKTLEQRLVGRGSENARSLELRLGEARKEIEVAIQSGVYNHQVINDDLERTVQEVLGIVQESK